MRARTIIKTYAAKVKGHLKKKEGELRHHLTHSSHHAQVTNTPSAKEATLSYEVKKEYPHATLLHTGHYHQIRAQFAHIGHPIIQISP